MRYNQAHPEVASSQRTLPQECNLHVVPHLEDVLEVLSCCPRPGTVCEPLS